MCNTTTTAVSGKNYTDGTLSFVNSTNRCYNVECLKGSECGDGKCWNASYCGGPTCNNTLEYLFWNETINQVDTQLATDLCGGFECLNDDPCYYGCSNATQCLFYWEYCNSSYKV